MSKRYSDIKPGDTVKGASGKVKVDSTKAGPNNTVIVRGTRPDTGKPATTWGRGDVETNAQ